MAEKSQTKAAAAMADDKKRAIETAMQQIERTYGKGSIMRFGDNTVSNVEAISTGSLALDLALGIGARDEHRGRNVERQTIELPLADEIRHRLARQVALDELARTLLHLGRGVE